MIFEVVVRQLVPTEELDHDDFWENPSGKHMVEAKDTEEALDKFHFTVPIAVLDDFEITCQPYRGPLPRGLHLSQNHL